MASRLGLQSSLSLNFMARHIKDTSVSIRVILDATERHNIELNRVILEIDQDKLIGDPAQLGKVIEEFRVAGLKISISHFGAGRAGLNLLEPYHPDMISLNINLVQGIDSNDPRQAIVRGVIQTCNDLGIDIIAKHVETLDEYWWLRDEGINFFKAICLQSLHLKNYRLLIILLNRENRYGNYITRCLICFSTDYRCQHWANCFL